MKQKVLKKSIKTDKPLVKTDKDEEREKTHIINIRNKTSDIISDPEAIKRTMKEYYELYSYKFENLQVDQFLQIYKLSYSTSTK